jgi:hypothetical protein
MVELCDDDPSSICTGGISQRRSATRRGGVVRKYLEWRTPVIGRVPECAASCGTVVHSLRVGRVSSVSPCPYSRWPSWSRTELHQRPPCTTLRAYAVCSLQSTVTTLFVPISSSSQSSPAAVFPARLNEAPARLALFPFPFSLHQQAHTTLPPFPPSPLPPFHPPTSLSPSSARPLRRAALTHSSSRRVGAVVGHLHAKSRIGVS